MNDKELWNEGILLNNIVQAFDTAFKELEEEEEYNSGMGCVGLAGKVI